MNIFITGISKGLGLALAKEYANRGDTVFGISRTEPEGLPEGILHQCADVTLDDAKNIVGQMVDQISCIDLLINNAGCGSSGFTADGVDTSELSNQIQLHCVGALRVTQALLPKLHKAAKPKIINVTSRLGSISQHLSGDFAGREFSYPYRIAKCAQNMLTVCLGADNSLEHITVAAVNPGLLRTDSGSSDSEHTAEDAASSMVPLIQSISKFGVFHTYNEPTEL